MFGISKAVHDAEIARLVDAHLDEIGHYKDALLRAEDRYDRLVDKVVNLRRDGFVAPAQPHVPSEPRVVGVVTTPTIQQAVDEIVKQAPDQHDAYTKLMRFVAFEQVKGTPEAEIIAAIKKGETAGKFSEDDDE